MNRQNIDMIIQPCDWEKHQHYIDQYPGVRNIGLGKVSCAKRLCLKIALQTLVQKGWSCTVTRQAGGRHLMEW